MTARRFELQRHVDETGVSGTGVVAEGVLFSNGVVALQWTSEFPTSVVFHQRGMESVEAVHGHSGSTEIVWLDAALSDSPIDQPHAPIGPD
jgi:hypothetical protein